MIAEPKRISDIEELVPYLQPRFHRLLMAMAKRGFDPVIIETRRTRERQRWLFGKGRTKAQLIVKGVNPAYAQPKLAKVTYTLDSMHIKGKACDVVSASRMWNHPDFFKALALEAENVGLHTLTFEACHVEWRG